MSAPWNAAYERVVGHARETSLLGSILSVLEWDERTMLPPAGADYRAEQETLLARMIHRRWTDSRFWDDLCLLADSPLAADPHGEIEALVDEVHDAIVQGQVDRDARIRPTVGGDRRC